MFYLVECKLIIMNHFHQAGAGRENGIEDGFRLIEFRILLQVTDAQVFTSDNVTRIGCLQPGQDMHKRTFSSTVACNQGHFLAFIDTKTDVTEKHFLAVSF